MASAAFRLASVVQVATAQVKNQNAVDLLLAAHYRQQEAQEEIGALRAQVSELTGVVAQLVAALGSAVAPGQGNARREGRGRTRGRTGAASLSAAGGLGGRGLSADSESELSNPPSDIDLE